MLPSKINTSENTVFCKSFWIPHFSSFLSCLQHHLFSVFWQASLPLAILFHWPLCFKLSFLFFYHSICSHSNFILLNSLITTHVQTSPKFRGPPKTFTENSDSCFQMLTGLLYLNIFQVLQSQISKIKLISPHSKPASFPAISL